MSVTINPEWGNIRPDFVPTDHFISREFLQLENERLWPRIWQVACREEEVPDVGSYVTYNILSESIVVVRVSKTELKAFYNVCQHRGRRLTEGCGKMRQFHCRYHGWQYDLKGKITRVLDRDEWNGCPDFTDEDISLKEVKIGSWGGFVFINMDPNCEPLEDFLAPVQKFLDPFEMQNMRYRWYASIKMPCNWKVALNAFNEAYHVFATHPQILSFYGDDVNRNRIYGRHSMFYYPGNPQYPMGAPSPRLNMPVPADLRPKIVEYYKAMNEQLRAVFTERDAEAVGRIMTEVDPSASIMEIMTKMMEFQREASIAAGAGWPALTSQQMIEAGTDWHIFPNVIVLPYPTGALGYRALPDPTDPDVCTFEVYSFQRYAPGAEPPLERQLLHGEGEWRNFKRINPFLQQDFDNIAQIQQGMKSRGFAGSRTNPEQELTVSNFHRALWEYISDEPRETELACAAE